MIKILYNNKRMKKKKFKMIIRWNNTMINMKSQKWNNMNKKKRKKFKITKKISRKMNSLSHIITNQFYKTITIIKILNNNSIFQMKYLPTQEK